MVIPCKGCTERNAECHVDCERYKEFQKVVERIRKERVKQKQKESCNFNSAYYTMTKERLKKFTKEH